MRAALSVIIPTLDAGQGLPACLGALVEGLEAGVIRELIVSDGGSGDANTDRDCEQPRGAGKVKSSESAT